jgi:predicted ferric reductase
VNGGQCVDSKDGTHRAHSDFEFQPGQFGWLTAWRTPFSDCEHPFTLVSSAENKDKVANVHQEPRPLHLAASKR